tara:strand:- start:239 stop:568 length:330 start_codon:yes stop_codon:yes gene_type:complete
MRYKQLIEGYEDELRSAIVNILTAINAEGIDTIDTDQLIIDLQAQGFSVDKNSIFKTLELLPIVANATSQTINIRSNDVTRASDAQTKDKEGKKIDALAQKHAKKDLGL